MPDTIRHLIPSVMLNNVILGSDPGLIQHLQFVIAGSARNLPPAAPQPRNTRVTRVRATFVHAQIIKPLRVCTKKVEGVHGLFGSEEF